MIRRATTKEPHRPKKGESNDNIISKSSQGTAKSYTLDRLDRERPDLYERVVDGEMSASTATGPPLFTDYKSPTDEQQTHESPRQQLPTRAEVR